jgi:hypothetical protein
LSARTGAGVIAHYGYAARIVSEIAKDPAIGKAIARTREAESARYMAGFFAGILSVSQWKLLGKRWLNAGQTGIVHFASRRTLGDGLAADRVYWDGPVVYSEEDDGRSWYLVPPFLSDKLGYNHPLWLLDALEDR